MYKNIFKDNKTEMIYLWDDRQKNPISIPFHSLKYAYKKSEHGNYVSMFGDKLEKVYNYNPGDTSLFESDVPIDTRLLVETYYESDEISNGHNVIVIDIETDSEGGFPDMEKADKCITAISIYDKNSDKYFTLILDKESLISSKVENNLEIKSFLTEESLLKSFLDLWEQLSPTIVTGWNSRGTYSQTVAQSKDDGTGFDIPYLYTRIDNLMGHKEVSRLSPIGIVYKTKFKKEIVIAGVCTALDYYPMYKRFSGVREPSYQLGKIGLKEVNIGKIEYEGSLHNLYRTNIQKYIDYNLNDVRIVVELDKKYNYIDQAREICHFCHVPYEYFEVSSRFLEGAVLTQLKKDNLISCNKPISGREEYEEQVKENEEGFEGAYVKIPVPGKYEWVYDLDMQSLYPSIIQSLNISPETLVGEIQNWNPTDFVAGKLTSVKIGVMEYNIDDFKKMIIDNNIGIASNGAMYKLGKTGIIPYVIDKWITERKSVRKQVSDAHDKGDKNLFNKLNRKQMVLKVLSNSIYGCLGLPIWRWYNKTNASAVTLTGQTLIKTCESIINQYYNNITKQNKDYVIYIDTDSLFVSSLPLIEILHSHIDKNDEKQMTQMTLEITTQVQKYINSMFDILSIKMFNVKHHKFFIKQELISKSAMWLAKKRYMQWVINDAGKTCSKMDVKGIDVVRTSFPPKFSKFMEDIMKQILNNNDKTKIDDEILKFEDDLKSFDLDDCAKSTSVRFSSKKGDIDYYPKNRKPFTIIDGSPAQVKAAIYYNDLLEKMNLQNVTERIYDGQKIRYAYLKDNCYGIECIALKQDGTNPKPMLDFIRQYVDTQKMYERELKSKLLDFFTILNWEYPTSEGRTAKQFFDF